MNQSLLTLQHVQDNSSLLHAVLMATTKDYHLGKDKYTIAQDYRQFLANYLQAPSQVLDPNSIINHQRLGINLDLDQAQDILRQGKVISDEFIPLLEDFFKINLKVAKKGEIKLYSPPHPDHHHVIVHKKKDRYSLAGLFEKNGRVSVKFDPKHPLLSEIKFG